MEREQVKKTGKPGPAKGVWAIYEGLFIDGGGRITCGSLDCAGMTAYFSGMKKDLHGAPIKRVDAREVAEFRGAGMLDLLACETCGKKAL